MTSKELFHPYAVYESKKPAPVNAHEEEDDDDVLGAGLDATLAQIDGDGDDGDGDGEPEDVEIKVYHTSDEVIRYQEAEQARKKGRGKGTNNKRKHKASKAWKPNGQYELVRRGKPLPADPETMGKDLSEEHLFYFRHVPLDDGRHVEFAHDPQRPLWKGVLKVPPDYGYGPDEYCSPTQAQFKVIYGPHLDADEMKIPGRDKANQPDDNMVMTRDGMSLPYWVDEWQLHKDNDQQHKMASRQKKEAQRKTLLPAGPVIRPLEGAMLAYIKEDQFAGHTLNLTGFCKASPANAVANRVGAAAVRAMRRKPAVQVAAPAAQVAVVPPEVQVAAPVAAPVAVQVAAPVAPLVVIPVVVPVVPPPSATVVVPVVPPPSAPVGRGLGNAAGLRKLKHSFLSGCDAEENPQQDREEILTAFVKFLVDQLGSQVEPAAMRKQKNGFLAETDVDQMDVEDMLTAFLRFVAAKIPDVK